MNVNGRFLRCWWHRRSLSLLAAEGLTPERARRVRAHLATCESCQRRWAQLQAVVHIGTRLAERLPAVDASVGMSRRWERRVRESAADAGRPGNRRAREAMGALTRPRLAWGALAVLWGMVVFFRCSAPGLAKAEVEVTPVSWGQVWMVLGTGGQRGTSPVAAMPSLEVPSTLPPAFRSRGDRGEAWEIMNWRNA